MGKGAKTVIRSFNGSLADAQGLLDVERAVFNESPYSAEQLQVMLTGGPQRTWLAVANGSVTGFVVAFTTSGLHGPRWEIDLLAVLPDWRKRGLATRLIRAATVQGSRVAPEARAFVATDNEASARAFGQAGFRAKPQLRKLLIYRTEGLVRREGQTPHVRAKAGVTIRETATLAEATDWLPELQPPVDHPDLTLLLAEQYGEPAGYAELVEVQTLLYRGVWIESLTAAVRAVREALVHEAVNWAVDAGQDEIGAMVPAPDWRLQDSLRARGFRSLDDFYWLTARLPLPGLAAGQNTTSGSDGSHG
ncbi:GNAT family N-acetyltransferase [Chloroflexota bacterium]